MSVLQQAFELRGQLPKRAELVVQIIGFLLVVALWYAAVSLRWVKPGLLPLPHEVVLSYPRLHFEEALVRNALFSCWLNFLGYLVAIAISLPLGYFIGLSPIGRAMAERGINALRFLPLSALVGLFIGWFGVYTKMKVLFLAVGIVVYLTPLVVARIREVPQEYVDTLKTCGASKFQIIRDVFIPDGIARVWPDMRVMAGVSWSYIILAEVVNKAQGGIGTMCHTAGFQGRNNETFALLILVILIGIVWDRILLLLDTWIFPHKYVKGGK